MNLLAERCRIVLVRPSIAANIGATARAMHNFGLTRLHLVAPAASPLEDSARHLATHGEHVLGASRICPSLEEAVADCTVVVGTSARKEGLIRGCSVSTPKACMPSLLSGLQSGEVALVFGPETTGLTNAEVMLCHHLVSIPASPEYPVLNLAQSVVICLYELFQAGNPEMMLPVYPDLADHTMQQQAFLHLESALRDIHFLWDERAPVQMNALRQILVRAKLSKHEVGLLHGVARQLQWYARTHGPKSGETATPPDSLS